MALKICIAIPGLPEASTPDDAVQDCMTLAKQFADHGHEITLVTSASMPTHAASSATVGELGDPKISIITLEPLTEAQVIAGWFRRRSYELFRWLKSEAAAFDCVIAPAWQAIAYYALLAKQQGMGFEHTRFVTHIDAPTQWRYQTRLAMPASVDALEVMFMEREVVRRADAAVITNSGLRTWLADNGWALPKIVDTIPPLAASHAHGRGQAKYAVATASRLDVPDNSGVAGGATAPIRELVFAGQLDSVDAVELFCDAIKALPATLHNTLTISFIGAIGEVGQLAGDWYVTRALRSTGCHYSIVHSPTAQQQLQYLQGSGRVAIFAPPFGALPQLLVQCTSTHIPILFPEHCGLRDYLPAEAFMKHSFTPTAVGLSEKIQAVLKECDAGLELPELQQLATERWEHLLHTICASKVSASRESGHESAASAMNAAVGAEEPMISVCLVHYNRPDTLRQAVDSLQAQSYGNFEVILVDDGSPSAEAKAFLDSLEEEFAARKWRIIRQANAYMWRARNHAARQARGDYLAFMDDDNIAMPHWLASAVKVAQRTHADVVTSTMTLFHGAVPPNPTTLYPMWVPLGAAAAAGAFLNVFGDVHCLVKRRVFEELGGFEERYSGYQEDWEFFARAVLAGHKLELIPEPMLLYRISKNSVSRSNEQNWNANRGCSIQPYLNATKPELRDLIPLMLENQRLYSGMAAKRSRGRWKLLRDANRWWRGRAGDAPVVVASAAGALRAAGAIPVRRRCPRR